MSDAGGQVAIEPDRLAHEVAKVARALAGGTVIVHLPSGTVCAWDHMRRDLGHDTLCVPVPPGSDGDSDGDLLARSLEAVEAELERHDERLAARRLLGLPTRSTDGWE